MTVKQKAYKKSLIQQVHVSQKYQEYYKENKEDYRSKLQEHFGESSSKDMNIEQLLVLEKWLNYDLPDLPIIKDRSKDATEAQITLIHQLWDRYAKDTSQKALRAFIAKITKNTYLHLDKLSKADATKCILALKNTLKEL
ncbi:MAG: hypothetical protein DRI37_02910 [Chloroflexi bacterium]|nr:MAG: hypothetical protein DRI37_02910 [Chloroflexota bacterium]